MTTRLTWCGFVELDSEFPSSRALWHRREVDSSDDCGLGSCGVPIFSSIVRVVELMETTDGLGTDSAGYRTL